MESGDGREGDKKCKADGIWVKGEVIKGERERVYWEAVFNAKRNKKSAR